MQLTVREKVAYGLGDTASNIIFQSVMLFLTYFYTDIFGLEPAIVGTLFLAVRLIDAITDPLMGGMCDRTNSRFGKFRPYLLWFSVPFAVCSVMAFTTPDLSPDGKVIYAYVSYTLLMIAYTAINIPYSALGGALTSDAKQRVSIQSYRFVFGMLGGLIVSAGTMKLVEYFGQGDAAKGYQLAMTAMSLLGLVLFLLCFAGTKERVVIEPSQNSFKQDFIALFRNDQWRILSLAALILLVGMVLRNALIIYYVEYYLQQKDMVDTFITVGMIGSILGCAVAAPLANRVDKVKAYISLQLIAALICASSVLIDRHQLELAMVMHFLWGFFLQMATPLLWAKMADVIDYGHYKTGTRITGMVYASVVFFIKLGVAIGGAAAGWLLSFYGYQAGQAQSQQTLTGLVWCFTLFPAISSVLVALVMKAYKLNNQRVAEIQQQLQLTDNQPQTAGITEQQLAASATAKTSE